MKKNDIEKEVAKFKVGDEVFVCDGDECHGKIAVITKVDTSYQPPRCDGFFKGDKAKFSFARENEFCFIEKGTCELCGSGEGIVKPPYPIPEYGDVHDIARKKFPYFVSCVCPQCQKILDLREEKRQQAVKARVDFIDKERARREKEHLCTECGGEINASGPYMVYEGTYETRYRCKHCGKGWAYT